MTSACHQIIDQRSSLQGSGIIGPFMRIRNTVTEEQGFMRTFDVRTSMSFVLVTKFGGRIFERGTGCEWIMATWLFCTCSEARSR